LSALPTIKKPTEQQIFEGQFIERVSEFKEEEEESKQGLNTE